MKRYVINTKIRRSPWEKSFVESAMLTECQTAKNESTSTNPKKVSFSLRTTNAYDLNDVCNGTQLKWENYIKDEKYIVFVFKDEKTFAVKQAHN